MKEHLISYVFAFAASYIALYWGCIIHKKRLFMCSKNDSAHAYCILNQLYFNKNAWMFIESTKSNVRFLMFLTVYRKIFWTNNLINPVLKPSFVQFTVRQWDQYTREFNVCWTFRSPRWPVKPRSTSSRPRSSRNKHVPGPAKTQVRQWKSSETSQAGTPKPAEQYRWASNVMEPVMKTMNLP